MRPRTLVLAIIVAAVSAGCGTDSAVSPPASVEAVGSVSPSGTANDPVRGVPYPMRLETHCGFQYADFDDRRWFATARYEEALPAGQDVTQGTMTLLDEDTSQFDWGGGFVTFESTPQVASSGLCR